MLSKDERLWLSSQERGGRSYLHPSDRRCSDSGRRVCLDPCSPPRCPLSPGPGATSLSPPSPPSVPRQHKPPGGLCCPGLEGQAWNPGSGLSKVLVKAQMGSRWNPQDMRVPDPGSTAAATGPPGHPGAPELLTASRVGVQPWRLPGNQTPVTPVRRPAHSPPFPPLSRE